MVLSCSYAFALSSINTSAFDRKQKRETRVNAWKIEPKRTKRWVVTPYCHYTCGFHQDTFWAVVPLSLLQNFMVSANNPKGIKEIIIIIKVEDVKKEFFNRIHTSTATNELCKGSPRCWLERSILNRSTNWAITAKRRSAGVDDDCFVHSWNRIWLFAVFSVRFKSTVKFPQEWHLFKPMRVFVPVMRRRQVDGVSKFQRLFNSVSKRFQMDWQIVIIFSLQIWTKEMSIMLNSPQMSSESKWNGFYLGHGLF